jgi:hypothetical protein
MENTTQQQQHKHCTDLNLQYPKQKPTNQKKKIKGLKREIRKLFQN